MFHIYAVAPKGARAIGPQGRAKLPLCGCLKAFSEIYGGTLTSREGAEAGGKSGRQGGKNEREGWGEEREGMEAGREKESEGERESFAKTSSTCQAQLAPYMGFEGSVTLLSCLT